MSEALVEAPTAAAPETASAAPLMASAPDVGSFSADAASAPDVQPAGEIDPLQQAIYDNTKNLPSPDAIVEHGQQVGAPPEETAMALQRLKASSADAMQKVAEDNPDLTDRAYAQRDSIDQEINKRIADQRQQATAQWAQDNFQTKDDFQNFANQYDASPQAAAQQNPQAYAGISRILKHPAFQEHRAGPAHRLTSPEGNDYGIAKAYPDMRGGYDVHVMLSNGAGSGHFKVKGGATKKEAYDAFVGSPIGKKAGESHFWSGAAASGGKAISDIGAAVLDKLSAIPGLGQLHDASTSLRQYGRQEYEMADKTTTPTLLGDAERNAEDVAGKLPIWAVMRQAGLPTEMFASAEARGKNMADDLMDQAWNEPDAAKSKKLKEQAEQVRDYAWLYGAASAVTAIVAGKLASMPVKAVVKLLPEAAQKAFAEKIASLPGAAAAETANITAIEAMQGQVVDPAFGYERAPLSNLINPGNLLFGAVFGGKRWHSGKEARARMEEIKKTADDVREGKINSAGQILEAIHGKAEDTEPAAVKDEAAQVEESIKASEAERAEIDKWAKQREESWTPAPNPVNEAHASGTESGLTDTGSPEGDLLNDFGIPRPVTPPKAPPSRQPILANAPMTGDTVAYNGYVGTLVMDGPRLEVHTDDGKIVEVEDNDPRLLKKVESTVPFGTYAYAGKSGWRFLKPNVTNKGRLNSVTLVHPDGSKTKVPLPQAYDIAAREREIERTGGKLYMHGPISLMVDSIRLMARQAKDLADFSRRALTKFGEWIRPHLAALWEAAKKSAAAVHEYLQGVWQHAKSSSEIGAVGKFSSAGIKSAVAAKAANVHAPGGSIALPARKFQDTSETIRPGAFNRVNPSATRSRHQEIEPFRQLANEHDGEVNAGNMAFDALQQTREKEAAKLDPAKFEKDSLLGAAIHVYRQAKGDASVLTDQRDQLKAKGGSQYAPVWNKALALTDAEKKLSDKVTQDYRQNALTAQAAGVPLEVDEAYGKQVWDLENNRGKKGFGEFLSRFESDPSSFKKRKHASSFDGIMAGLTPKTLDDFKLVGVNGKEVNRALATRKFAQKVVELRDSKGAPFAIIDSDQAIHLNDNAVDRLKELAASGVAIPVQMRSYIRYHKYAVGGSQVEHFDPEGYMPAGGRGVQGYYFQLPPPAEDIAAAKAAGGTAKMKNYFGRLLFSPEVFPYINARTEPSWVRKAASQPNLPGYLWKGALEINKQIKGALLGGLSAFHYVQEGFHGLGHGTNPLWNLPPVDPLNPEHLKWMKSGLMLGGESDAIKYFEGGGASDALFYKIPIVGTWSKALSEHLFLRYIPALKLKTAQNVYERNLKRFSGKLADGRMTDDDVRHITATTVNDAYGHLNWADLRITKSQRDLMSIVALAPDFLTARIRFAAQALGVQRLRGVDASVAGREAMAAFFALAAGQWLVARISNYLLNDGDMMTDSKNLFSVVNKKSGQRFTLRSVPGDLLEAVKDPVAFLNNRASPMVRDLYNIIRGKNWRDENVGHVAAAGDAAVGALPMTMQPLLRGLTTTGAQSPTSKLEDFFRAAGVKINRYSQLGEAKSKAHDYMSIYGAKTGTDFHQPSIYNPLVFHLLDGDDAGAKEEVDKLTHGDRRELERTVKGFHASLFRAFTGDAVHEVNFRREMAKDPSNAQVIRDADRQRIEAWQRFVKVAQVPSDLRQKYQPRTANPTQATLDKARETRLEESAAR